MKDLRGRIARGAGARRPHAARTIPHLRRGIRGRLGNDSFAGLIPISRLLPPCRVCDPEGTAAGLGRTRVEAILPGVLAVEEKDLAAFEQRLGYRFHNREVLARALTHKSFSHESRSREVADNETFEFLGDSVLGFIVGDMIFRRFPSLDEGALSKMKAYLVSATSLSAKARFYGMGDVLFLGVGEEKSGGRKKDSLLANLFEAMLAGVYLDGGVDAVRGVVERAFQSDLDSIDVDDLLFHDYKTALQELAQGRGLQLPEYRVIDEIGPDHDKRFVIEVHIGTGRIASGEGSSKKEAQQQAARQALRVYAERDEPEP
jgi:ribonuclease-3